MPRPTPQRVSATPVNPHGHVPGGLDNSAIPNTPTVFDADHARFHASMFCRLLCIRTQACVFFCMALICFTWLVSVCGGVISVWLSH